MVDDGAANEANDIYGYLVRVLTGVTFKTYSGSAANAGFKVGQIYAINETGADRNKLLLKVAGKTVLEWTLKAAFDAKTISWIGSLGSS